MITHLYIENIEYEILSKQELFDKCSERNLKGILDKYECNYNSYCLFYILSRTNLLKILKEIHFKQEDSIFCEDLFKLLAKYHTKHKIEQKTKIFYYDPAMEHEIEIMINQEYWNERTENRNIWRQQITCSKPYDKLAILGNSGLYALGLLIKEISSENSYEDKKKSNSVGLSSFSTTSVKSSFVSPSSKLSPSSLEVDILENVETEVSTESEGTISSSSETNRKSQFIDLNLSHSEREGIYQAL